jgi:hypothetical protein
MTDHPIPADAIAAVLRHMNDDHAEDALLICQTLGGQPNATSARMTGVMRSGVAFVADVDGVAVDVLLQTLPLNERATIRTEIVRLYDLARAAAGLPPRDADGANHEHPTEGTR